MPGGVMTDVQVVAANVTTGNIFAGNVFEFITLPSLVRVYIVSQFAGLNVDVLVGNESYASDQEVSAADRFPIRNEDLLVELGALPGERIVIRLRETAGLGPIVRSLVEILPV